MPFDIRFLTEFLTSPAWEWTGRGVESLMRSLRATEVPDGQRADRREFRAGPELHCIVIADESTKAPVRLEFPIEIAPMADTSRAELVEAYFAMLYAAIEEMRGRPPVDPYAIIESGMATTGRASWPLDSFTMAAETRAATDGSGPDLVVLSFEKHDRP